MSRQLARTLGPLGLTLSLCLLAGCNSGSRSSNAQTSAASTAQPTSQASGVATATSSATSSTGTATTQSTWDTAYTAMPISTDGVQALYVLPSGGLAAASHFSGKDAILSGPAGGVVAAAQLAEGARLDRVIAFDIARNTTDVRLIYLGQGLEEV